MEQFKETKKEYPWFYPMIVGAFLVIAGIVIGGYLFGSENPVYSGNMLSYITNIWTELIGISVTIFIIDRLYRNREEKERDSREHDTLRDNLLMKIRIGELHTKQEVFAAGIFLDVFSGEQSILRGQNLKYLDLSAIRIGSSIGTGKLINPNSVIPMVVVFDSSDLKGASFSGSFIGYSSFIDTNLILANFSRTKGEFCDFEGANMQRTNHSEVRWGAVSFRNAQLVSGRFQHAQFENCDLRGANLRNGNFTDARFTVCKFDESTILPDSELFEGELVIKYWTPETDMTRYTNPEHPDFWQPDWVKEKDKEKNV